MLKVLFVVITFFFFHDIAAQSISQSVIGSTGNFSSASWCTVASCAGETVVETFKGSPNILTQGFEQPTDFAVAVTVEHLNTVEWEILLYPNPTFDFVQVLIASSDSHSFELSLYDLAGRVLYP